MSATELSCKLSIYAIALLSIRYTMLIQSQTIILQTGIHSNCISYIIDMLRVNFGLSVMLTRRREMYIQTVRLNGDMM